MTKEPTFPLRLTQAQRRAVAGLLPDIRPQLLLDQANQRVVRLTLDQIEFIAKTRLHPIPKAKTGMERNSLEHAVIFAQQAMDKYGKSKLAIALYMESVRSQGVENADEAFMAVFLKELV